MVIDFISHFWKWSRNAFKKGFLTFFAISYYLTSNAKCHWNPIKGTFFQSLRPGAYSGMVFRNILHIKRGQGVQKLPKNNFFDDFFSVFYVFGSKSVKRGWGRVWSGVG